MDQDLIRTSRFLVVEDRENKNQQRMHLDTYFNLCDEKLCVCFADITDDRPGFQRIARESIRHDDGTYKELKPFPFWAWLRKERYVIVRASYQQQANYFLNFLHLGRDTNGHSRILATNLDVEAAIRDAGFVGRVGTIEFGLITAMYGGVHCSTQRLSFPMFMHCVAVSIRATNGD
jgi:N-dimethylarginine dimethylaminohydrolase